MSHDMFSSLDSFVAVSSAASSLLVRDLAGEYRPADADEVLQAAQRVLAGRVRGTDVLTSPAVVKEFLRARLGNLPHEIFAVVHLDAQHSDFAYDLRALVARQSLPSYLPARVPLLKRAGAAASQNVCIVGRSVRIDGTPVAAALPSKRMGRPLHAWPQCRRLRAGQIFLLSVMNPASFDSRYFGPVSASTVIGIAHPVWLESRR